MIRARDQVYLVYEKSPSEFVTMIGETVVQRQEPIIRDYKVKHRPTPTPDRRAATPALVAISVPAQAVPEDWDENCETCLTEWESEVLKRYFARNVYREQPVFPRVMQAEDSRFTAS
jgi:hypothetical protein